MCQMGKAFSTARMAATANVTFGRDENDKRMSRRWFLGDWSAMGMETNERWDNVKWKDPARDGLFIR